MVLGGGGGSCRLWQSVLHISFFRYSQIHLHENRGFMIPAPRNISNRPSFCCESGIAKANLVVGNRPLPRASGIANIRDKEARYSQDRLSKGGWGN